MSAVAVAEATDAPVELFSQLALLDAAALTGHPDAAADLLAIADRAREAKAALRAAEVPSPGPRPPMTFAPLWIPRTVRVLIDLRHHVLDKRRRAEHDRAVDERRAWWRRVHALEGAVEREATAWRDGLDPHARRAATDDLHAALQVLEERGLRSALTEGQRPPLGWCTLRASLAHD